MTAKIRYRPSIGTASGRRKGWMKHVTSVDADATNGRGVHGEWLDDGKLVELPAGAVILDVYPKGSVKHGWLRGRVYRLVGQGLSEDQPDLREFTPDDEEMDWRKDFLRVRDALVEALSSTRREEEPFARYFSGGFEIRISGDGSFLVSLHDREPIHVMPDAALMLARAIIDASQGPEEIGKTKEPDSRLVDVPDEEFLNELYRRMKTGLDPNAWLESVEEREEEED